MNLKLSLLAAAGAILAVAPASAATNLLTNGSFENYSGGATSNGTTYGTSSSPLTITGWTVTKSAGASNTGDGVSIQSIPGTTRFGNPATADNATSISSDAAGTHAAYFYDDTATETLSQSVSLTAGQTYSIGFDYTQVQTGNSGPFTLTAMFGNQQISSATSASALPAGQWFNVAQTFVASTTGTYDFNFTYNSGAAAAADAMVDRVYVQAVPGAVPEPASWAMMIGGFGMVGGAMRRRRANIAFA